MLLQYNSVNPYPAPIPVGRGGMGKAVFSNGKCYVFGGEASNPAAPANPALGLNALGTYTRVDIYTISTNTWSEGDVRCPV